MMIGKNNKFLSDQNGSMFFYILLGVVLFAALSYMLARTMRAQGTDVMGKQEIKLAVSDIVDYAQKAEYAVQKILRKDCSENDVSFDTTLWGYTDYQHSLPPADTCQVFDGDGGGLQWRDAPEFAASGATWMFQNNIAITGVGTEPPSSGSTYGSELVLVLSLNSKELCMAINDGLGIENAVEDATLGTKPPYDVADIETFSPFVGTFSADITLVGENNQLEGKPAGCVTRDPAKDAPDGPYLFYYTLIAR